jgi:hypothetical protein
MEAGSDDVEGARADRTRRRSWSERGGAWIGLLGVIVGGLLTGVPAYISADKQIAAASSQSNAEFHREQQRQAYAEFITDEKSLIGLENDFYAVVKPQVFPVHDIPIAQYLKQQDIDALPAKQRLIVEAMQKFDNAYAVVELVGSTRTATIAEQIVDQHRKTAEAISGPGDQPLAQRMLYSFGVNIREFGKPDPFLPDAGYGTAEGVRLTSEAEFMVAARDDLGSY